MELARARKIEIPELSHIVKNIEKIEGLLKRIDYGGERGTSFRPSPEKGPGKGRRARRKSKRLERRKVERKERKTERKTEERKERKTE